MELVTTSSATLAEVQSNFDELSCNGPLDTFNPAAGAIVDFFCDTTGGTVTALPSANQHRTRTFSTQNCIDWISWIETGGTGSELPTCP